MRAPTTIIFSLVVAASVAEPIGNGVDGQTNLPQLKAAVDLRIDTALATPVRQAAILPAASGDIVVSPIESQGVIRWFNASGGALEFKAPVNYRNDADVRWVSRIGWSGSTLIAIDPGFRQIALFDRAGKVTKSVEYPAMIRPAWSDRHKYPLFSRYDALALYPNGELLVRPAEPKELMSTKDYDSTFSYFMRASENGSILRIIGRVPRNEGILERRSGSSRWVSRVPFFPRTMTDVSPDGSRILLVSQAVKGADSGSYRVVVLGEKGDTLLSKRFPVALTAISKKSVDSAVARVSGGMRDYSVEQLRGFVAKEIPPVYPPVEGALLGADKTIWIQLRSPSADRRWLALDSNGTALGVVLVAKSFVAKAATRTTLWGFEAEGEQLRALVRYAITPGTAGKR